MSYCSVCKGTTKCWDCHGTIHWRLPGHIATTAGLIADLTLSMQSELGGHVAEHATDREFAAIVPQFRKQEMASLCARIA
jgi:hypothetical protein